MIFRSINRYLIAQSGCETVLRWVTALLRGGYAVCMGVFSYVRSRGSDLLRARLTQEV